MLRKEIECLEARTMPALCVWTAPAAWEGSSYLRADDPANWLDQRVPTSGDSLSFLPGTADCWVPRAIGSVNGLALAGGFGKTVQFEADEIDVMGTASVDSGTVKAGKIILFDGPLTTTGDVEFDARDKLWLRDQSNLGGNVSIKSSLYNDYDAVITLAEGASVGSNPDFYKSSKNFGTINCPNTATVSVWLMNQGVIRSSGNLTLNQFVLGGGTLIATDGGTLRCAGSGQIPDAGFPSASAEDQDLSIGAGSKMIFDDGMYRPGMLVTVGSGTAEIRGDVWGDMTHITVYDYQSILKIDGTLSLTASTIGVNLDYGQNEIGRVQAKAVNIDSTTKITVSESGLPITGTWHVIETVQGVSGLPALTNADLLLWATPTTIDVESTEFHPNDNGVWGW